MNAQTDHQAPRITVPADRPFSLSGFFLRWEWLLIILIAILGVINTSISPYFLNVVNLFDMTFNFMEKGIMALAMTMVILTGGIDLSVASTLAMSSATMAVLFKHGVPIWIAALAALGVGVLGGWLNGKMITKIQLPPLAVTLGTYALYRGLAFAMLGDIPVKGYPQYFTYVGQGYIGSSPVPFSLFVFIVLAVLFALLLHRTSFGRAVFAIGNNEEACRYAGINVTRVKTVLYMLSGLMAAVAALIMAARFGSTRTDVATGYELHVITAVVLGGTDISGGKGTMWGTILAVFLLGIIEWGMGLKMVPGQVQQIVSGAVLIFAILLPNVIGRFVTR
ncbi:branched-chain amino acid ABC transporter permease [candidate division KSB3 bacterium]|uniref:Autoinducer 2 import system permease protein LsrD n=1 Tax=candidate division KSB3 bacterium TaxID=2044937 RepID=A0A2G6E405_9BACT|nr:MAG: branched-chain amino acid ABC transporter permease [candidate division KSB3 bacterium]PIE29342.1 MAG: branched-chain amino acid ABC transporter permease [candidate division KSB3 bacterium]